MSAAAGLRGYWTSQAWPRYETAMTNHGFIAVFLLLAGWLAPVPALAQQDLPVEAFYGRFQGTGIAENRDSLYFGVTVRDLDVTIGPSAPGFYVEWTSVIRSGGDPNNPDVRRKTARLTFHPGDRPGIFQPADAARPLAGDQLTWAAVNGTTLTVNLLVVRDDGGYEVQSYDRTLSGTGMELNFVRIRNVEPVRQVEGRLIKVGN